MGNWTVKGSVKLTTTCTYHRVRVSCNCALFIVITTVTHVQVLKPVWPSFIWMTQKKMLWQTLLASLYVEKTETFLKYIFFCLPQKKVILVWNDLRVS